MLWRGSEDLSFEVYGGHLGITVSPSLYRLKCVRVSRIKPQEAERKEAGAGRRIAVVFHRPEDARRHDPSKPALVEVPGELARKVLFLMKALESSGKLKKMARGAAIDGPALSGIAGKNLHCRSQVRR